MRLPQPVSKKLSKKDRLRNDRKEFNMKIDKDLCDVCGTCAAVCPKAVITIKEFEVIINNDACSKCKTCMKVCPAQAISED